MRSLMTCWLGDMPPQIELTDEHYQQITKRLGYSIERERILVGKHQDKIGNENLFFYILPVKVKYTYPPSLNPKSEIGENCIIFHSTGILEPIYLGNNCVIGANATLGAYTQVADNVSIGENALLVPGAYAQKDVPKHGLVYTANIVAGYRILKFKLRALICGL